MFAGQHKIIGILGGMGPQATMDFYHQILRLTAQISGVAVEQDHISTLIFSNPKIPDRASSQQGERRKLLERYLIDSAKVLEQGGADVIAMPCNSAHIAHQQIQAATSLPVLDMIAITGERLVQQGYNKVLLLGATATYQTGLYQQQLDDLGIEVVCPSDEQKAMLMTMIKDVKLEHDLVHARGHLLEMMYSFDLPVILGCTELPIIVGEANVERSLINPTELLAKAAVQYVLQKEHRT